MYLVTRLFERAPTGPYVVDAKEHADAGDAEAQAALWWRSGLTRGVVVQTAEQVADFDLPPEAVYLRSGFDRARVPPEWRWFGGQDPATKTAPASGRLEPAALDVAAAPETKPGRSADTLQRCGCCGSRRYGSRQPDESPRDATPSGRLADGRCAACGARLRGISPSELSAMYHRYLSGP